MLQFIFCLFLTVALPASAQVPQLTVDVKRVPLDDGHVFDVTASGTVAAAPAAVWKILTNYERMPEFVPDLRQARVLARVGNEAIVDQLGSASFLFFRRDIHLVVRVTETPINVIDIALVSGDMKVYACRWELVPLPDSGGTRIQYSGKLAPNFYVPDMLGASIIRADVQRMMDAVLVRLDRPD